MEKSVIQYGYCPLKGSEYFVSVKYKLFDINRIKSAILNVHILLIMKNTVLIRKSVQLKGQRRKFWNS